MNVGSLNVRFGATGGSEIESEAEKGEQALKSLEAQQDRTSTSSAGLSSSVRSTASQFSTDLVQSAQDARFGIENLAASAPFLNEQFQRLRQQAGGTSGALGSLVAALKGPTGVIAAITVLLSFSGEIASFFSSWASGADDAKDSTDGLKKAAKSLVNVDPGFGTKDINNLDRAQRFLSRVRGEIEQIQNLQDLEEALSGPEAQAVDDVTRLGDVRAILGDMELSVEDIRQADGTGLQLVRERLNAREGELSELKKIESRLEGQINAAETTQDIYEQLPQDLRESNKELEKFLKATEGATSRSGPDASAAPAAGPQTGGIPAAGDIELKPRRLTETERVLANIRARIQQIGVSLKQNLGRTARFGVQRLNKTFADTLARLALFPDEVSSAADAFKQLGRTAKRVLQQLVSQIIQAITRVIALKVIAGIASLGGAGLGAIVPTVGGPGSTVGGGLAASTTATASVQGGSLVIPTEQVTNAANDGASNQDRLARG